MLKGKHLIAGKWIGGMDTFANQPVSGKEDIFAVGTLENVEQAVQAAEDAFLSYGYSKCTERAEFLRTIAKQIDLLGEEITQMGCKETGLPEARLIGERARTTGQLNLFAQHIEDGKYLDKRYDEALPNREPLPRPEIKLIQRPVGPVAVFGASNFPLAFSTIGGDSVSALAAGCPVVVRGHSAHPGTADFVAQAIANAIKICKIHPGVFSQIQGGGNDIGQAIVKHPLIKAVGFTGSLAGGRALFDICAQRAEPIPFFGELGSINPMFILNDALKARGAEIAAGWVQSLIMGAGQFCTNPGVAIVIAGKEQQVFTDTVKDALSSVDSQVMLTQDITSAYCNGSDRIKNIENVEELLTATCNSRDATPCLFTTTATTWLANDGLAEEVFGALGIIVVAKDKAQMRAIAKSLQGQLTCTLHMNYSDIDDAKVLMPVLERKAGRILANGFPTGVEVCDAMVHGGPYPASTNFGASSVGTMSIKRWLRFVSYQNIDNDLLPGGLKNLGTAL